MCFDEISIRRMVLSEKIHSIFWRTIYFEFRHICLNESYMLFVDVICILYVCVLFIVCICSFICLVCVHLLKVFLLSLALFPSIDPKCTANLLCDRCVYVHNSPSLFLPSYIGLLGGALRKYFLCSFSYVVS